MVEETVLDIGLYLTQKNAKMILLETCKKRVCTHLAKLLEAIDFMQKSSKEKNLRLCLRERVSSTN